MPYDISIFFLLLLARRMESGLMAVQPPNRIVKEKWSFPFASGFYALSST